MLNDFTEEYLTTQEILQMIPHLKRKRGAFSLIYFNVNEIDKLLSEINKTGAKTQVKYSNTVLYIN